MSIVSVPSRRRLSSQARIIQRRESPPLIGPGPIATPIWEKSSAAIDRARYRPTFYGPIIGVTALTVLNEVVLRALNVDQMRPMLYGAILIVSILFLPKGLESLGPKPRAGSPAARTSARRSGRARLSSRRNKR